MLFGTRTKPPYVSRCYALLCCMCMRIECKYVDQTFTPALAYTIAATMANIYVHTYMWVCIIRNIFVLYKTATILLLYANNGTCLVRLIHARIHVCMWLHKVECKQTKLHYLL